MKRPVRLLRFRVQSGRHTRPAVVAVCSHATGRARHGPLAERLVPRSDGEIRARAQALGREYFGTSWSVSVTLLDEPDG